MTFAAGLLQWWRATPMTELIWVGIRLTAQLMFSMRFLVQWIATEKARMSTMPESFWYFSFFGGIMLLAYACYRVDPVFIVGQAIGLVIYTRNLYFIWLGNAPQVRSSLLNKIALDTGKDPFPLVSLSATASRDTRSDVLCSVCWAQQLGPLAVGPRKCDARQPNRASDAWIEDIQHASSMSMSGARIILLQKAFASRGDAIGLLILGSFLVVLSIPILRDLNSLPTNFNVDAYQHLSFAYTFYDAVRHHGVESVFRRGHSLGRLYL
jgi:lipid-A-disaccharide synthase-like uncharacterized protein